MCGRRLALFVLRPQRAHFSQAGLNADMLRREVARRCEARISSEQLAWKLGSACATGLLAEGMRTVL
jgi:hypothetical protein